MSLLAKLPAKARDCDCGYPEGDVRYDGIGVSPVEKNKLRSLLFFLGICYAVAFIAGMMTRPEIAGWYEHLAKPAWRPPNWLFAPAWTILYGLMAVAGWKVWCAPASRLRDAALWVFGLQLTLNFLWSPIFFSLHRIGGGLVTITCLAGLLLTFIVLTLKFQKSSALLFVPYLLWVSFAATLNYTIWTMNTNSKAETNPTAMAMRFAGSADAEGFPPNSAWDKTAAISFDRDWKGENPDAKRATEVRVLWTPEILFLRFLAKYQSLNVYSDARNDGWRDQLWDRDVAETFLQPDSSDPLKYKEFEVAPNGFWIDLDISHGAKEELRSGLKRRVVLDEKNKMWAADLAIPMRRLTASFDAKHDWRVNFYRVEGPTEPRFYSAWSPTKTEQPNFHVPSKFGTLVFRDSP
jgi:benzodiazapine receptor